MMRPSHHNLGVAIALAVLAACSTASTQSGSVQSLSLNLTSTSSGSARVPKDVPELTQAGMLVARQWRSDALPVSLDYQEIDAPNPKVNGPEVRLRAYSPSTKGGYMITVRLDGARTTEFNGPVTWGTLSLPAVFVDLPVVSRIALANGMRAPVGSASLRVWAPRGAPPILAWMVHPRQGGEGRTVNGTTGEIITFDVTGYIASYNEQWQRAARGLRALLSRPRAAPGGIDFQFGGGGPDGSSPPYDDGSAGRAAYQQRAAEGRAYWSGDPELYNRVKNGECTWSDSSRIGC